MFFVKGGTWWNAQVFKATQQIVCGRKFVPSCAPVSRFPDFAPVAWQQTCKSSHDKTTKSSVFSSTVLTSTVLTSNRHMPSTLERWGQFARGCCGVPMAEIWVLKQVHFLQRCSSKDLTLFFPMPSSLSLWVWAALTHCYLTFLWHVS